MERTTVKFYQTGTFTVGNRLLAPHERSVEADRARTNSLNSGHRACQGCGEALGARYAIDTAMRATNQPADRRQRDRLPRSVLDAVSRDLVADPVDPLAVRQRRGGGVRRRRRDARAGPLRRPRRRAGWRRRHHRHRLRLPVGDVRAQRRRAVHLLRQRGVHEHRDPALERDAGGGAHGDHPGRGQRAGEPVRHRQERAPHRDGPRHPLRRDRQRGRPARPRGQDHAGDGVPRCALRPHPRALPARLGQRPGRHHQGRAAGRRERPVSAVRGGERPGHRGDEDPPPRARRRVPAAAEAIRPPVRRQARRSPAGADPGGRRPQHSRVRARRSARPGADQAPNREGAPA